MIKQVIVMRTKYTNDKGEPLSLRKGKLIAQGSHASSMWAIESIQDSLGVILLDDDMLEWIETGFTKIVLQVETEEELLELHNKAIESGLRSYVITDLGKTEFKEPTVTCMAIGPNKSEDIDKITGNLKLY